MIENWGDWGGIITKQIRPMDSVILPQGMTDVMLDDLKEFLDNKVSRFGIISQRKTPLLTCLPA